MIIVWLFLMCLLHHVCCQIDATLEKSTFGDRLHDKQLHKVYRNRRQNFVFPDDDDDRFPQSSWGRPLIQTTRIPKDFLTAYSANVLSTHPTYQPAAHQINQLTFTQRKTIQSPTPSNRLDYRLRKSQRSMYEQSLFSTDFI